MHTRRYFLQSSAAVLGGAMPGVSIAGPGISARSAGFRMPEEGERHLRTFMQWPVNKKVHRDRVFLELLQGAIAKVANAISEFEPVVMLMAREHEPGARKVLSKKVEIWDIATDDLWCRDSGPAFVVDGKGGLAVTQFNFNGWGNKQTHAHDGQIARRVAERLGLQIFDNGLVGEAGGVEQDGAGTLIAHESSWVNANRNTLDRAGVEALLCEALGAKSVIWAPGIKGADITDYHIDALARFVKPGVVVIQMPKAVVPDDPWSRAAFETHAILAAARDARGQPLELVRLPEPQKPRVKAADFVASYVNYYVCNGAVISAQFGDALADAEAASTLKRLYPGREIVTLNVDPIGECGGGIHCATHEQPAV